MKKKLKKVKKKAFNKVKPKLDLFTNFLVQGVILKINLQHCPSKEVKKNKNKTMGSIT